MLVGVAIVPWVVFDRVLVPLKGETVSLRTETVGWLAGFDQYNNNTTASHRRKESTRIVGQLRYLCSLQSDTGVTD
jgi:hypothetical protein